jgi:hypothetical protein
MLADTWGVDVLRALALPLVVVFVVVLLREPLGEFLRGISGHVNKLSLGWLSVEIAKVPEVRPLWKVEYSGIEVDVRRLTSAAVFDSYADTLLTHISEPGALDYAVVDLGNGDTWLASRLFLFAELLDRMRGLRCFVFIYTTSRSNRTYLGNARPQHVKWQLAQQYPWFETELTKAYNTTYETSPKSTAPLILSDRGAIDHYTAGRVCRLFLQFIQQEEVPTVATEQWNCLGSLWEHSSWLDITTVRRLLGAVISAEQIDDDSEADRKTRVRDLVACRGDFVALVNREGYNGLIDRRLIVEKIARETA